MPEFKKSDVRLASKVSISADRVYLRDLLNEISRRSGITLTAGERDASENEQLSVFLQDVAVADAMESIWSLLSYRTAEWTWSREGSGGRSSYRLSQPLRARRYAGGLANWVQDTFERECHELSKAASQSPDDRVRTVEQMCQELFPESTGLAAGFLRSERMWQGLHLFDLSLTADKQLRVLRGEETFQFALTDLPSEAREFAEGMYKAMRPNSRTSDGSMQASPIPVWLRFETVRGDGPMAVPSLYIMLDGLGGYAYAGAAPLERLYRKALLDRWVLDGETRIDTTLEATRVTDHETAASKPSTSGLDRRIAELAEGSKISVVARLPADRNDDPGPVRGRDIAHVLEGLRDPALMHKWRVGILLVSSYSWPFELADRVPYRVVRRLRELQVVGNGFIPLIELSRVSALLSTSQLRRLSVEFQCMAVAASLREILGFMGAGRGSSLGSSLEVRLTPESKAALVRMIGSESTRKAIERDEYSSLRITMHSAANGTPTERILSVDLISLDRRPSVVMSFVCRRSTPRSSFR